MPLCASASHLSSVYTRNRKEHLLYSQRSVISPPADTGQTGLWLYCSHSEGWGGQQERWIFEATWVSWQKQQLFWRWGTSIFSSCPNLFSLPLFITLQTPETPPTHLVCQAYTFKRQMQKLCVDVSVWEWVCETSGDKHNSPPPSIFLILHFWEDSFLVLSCGGFILKSAPLLPPPSHPPPQCLNYTQVLPSSFLQSPKLQSSTCGFKQKANTETRENRQFDSDHRASG